MIMWAMKELSPWVCMLPKGTQPPAGQTDAGRPCRAGRKEKWAPRDCLVNDVSCSQAFESTGGFYSGYPFQSKFSFYLLLDIT